MAAEPKAECEKVYPRTGGGNRRGFRKWRGGRGLSPHGRGKHGVLRGVRGGAGSIPARAGETAGGVGVSDYHPGLSPHGRGKLFRRYITPERTGSIPARAGETPAVLRSTWYPTVYPRTGGGNFFGGMEIVDDRGLSPHGRGKRPSLGLARNVLGSIPARAGETGAVASGGAVARSIPARAGETPSRPSAICLIRVYPRTGGGNRVRSRGRPDLRGLSPHGRGKRASSCRICRTIRSIPARAGETRKAYHLERPSPVYPRTGGGNRRPRQSPPRRQGLSPHGRGKHRRSSPPGPNLWSIPARAGETTPPTSEWTKPTVYPRTGGGNGNYTPQTPSHSGLSPHGRGKRGRRPG